MINIHVGCLVLTYIRPENVVAAICRIRTKENMDGPGNTVKAQSYAGCHQVTFKGKPRQDQTIDGEIFADPEENILAMCAFREIGFVAAYELLAVGGIYAPKLLVERHEEGVTHKTYLALRPQIFFKTIQMDISGSPCLIREADLSRALAIDRKADKNGVPEGSIKFFADELEALKAAFQTVNNLGIDNLMSHFNRPILADPIGILKK